MSVDQTFTMGQVHKKNLTEGKLCVLGVRGLKNAYDTVDRSLMFNDSECIVGEGGR